MKIPAIAGTANGCEQKNSVTSTIVAGKGCKPAAFKQRTDVAE
jgi:hypothetical protein